MNVVMKGGTNTFHGSLYEFNQVSRLTATPFFNNRSGQKKANALYNQYGATISGPVMRNRIFLLGSYEGMNNNRSNPTFATVPTAAQKRGDLSNLLGVGSNYQIYDPFSGVREGQRIRRQPFANNVIPQQLLNPITQNYLNEFYQPPNVAGQADGRSNFFAGQNGERTGYNHELGRADFNITDDHKLFFNVRRNIRIGSGANSLGHGISTVSSGTGTIRLNWGSMADYVYTISPTMMLNTRVNWTHYGEERKNYSFPFDMTSLGFPRSLADATLQEVLPRITMASGFTGLGDTSGGPLAYNTYQAFVSMTKIANRHTLKFGVDLRQYSDSQTDYSFASGTYDFNTNWTRGPLDNSSAAPLGQDFAAFLLGLPTGGGWDINTSRTNYSGYYGFFLQDDFSVSPNLTLNLGIRYELETPTTERHNRTTNGFDMTTPNPIAAAAQAAYARNPIPEIPADQFRVLGGLLFAGPSNRELYSTSKQAFSPRFGFAWRPAALGGKTVLRGGTGVFFFPYGITGYYQSGFNKRTELVPTLDGFLTPAATLSDPFPNGFIQPAGAADGLATFLGQAVEFFNPKLAAPYSVRWNFDVQRELAGDMVLQVGYMGNHAVHLEMNDVEQSYIPREYLSDAPIRDNASVNFLTANVPNPFAGLIPGTSLNGSTVQRSQLLLPFPQFTRANFTGVRQDGTNEGSSYFHSLQVRLEKRFSQGLSFLASYGYSRLIERRSRLNFSDIALEKRVAMEDRPQRFSLAASYDLPFGKGKAIASNANSLANHIIGGWIVTAIYTRQSGPPLTWTTDSVVYLGGDLNVNNRNIDEVFDVTRFNRVSAQQFTQNLNIRTFPSRFHNLRADGVDSWDLSAIKNFGIWERVRLQFRAEAFNAMNHARFAAPNLAPTNTNFGKITSQPQDQPRAIQLGLRLTW